MLLLALCKKWIAVYVSQVRIKFKLKIGHRMLTSGNINSNIAFKL
jgi:hypothetical protein